MFKLSLMMLMLSGCLADREAQDHAALMFANIAETARAQQNDNPPPIHKTARAIETAAEAGLKVLGYEID